MYSGATTDVLTITGATAGMNGYTYRVTLVPLALGSDLNSNTVTLTVSATNTWLGTTNAWGTSSNWSCGYVPTASSNVVIPTTSTNPVINATGAICNNLTINSGAALSFQSGANGVLEVKGNFTNSGTFTATAGKLKLSGTNQPIPAATYKDIEITGGGTKTIASTVNISGSLTLTNGYLSVSSYTLVLGNSATIVGGSASSFVLTNAGSGSMRIQNVGAGGKSTVTFPIGNSTTSYTPVTLTNTGTIDIFNARVINTVNDSYNAGSIPNGTAQTTNNVNKTWIITEGTAGGSTVNLTFGWSAADQQSGFTNTACFPGHYESNRWNPELPARAADGSGPYSITMSGITSFSPFAVGSQGSVIEAASTALPLDLLSFSGKNTSAGTQLSWVTANEKEVAGFEVERSENGKTYATIAQLAAKGAGNEMETSYSYTDAQAPATGKSYYRLKMKDLDGSFKYSNVVAIKTTADNNPAISLYPNPASGNEVFVQMNGFKVASLEIKMVNVSGQIVYRNTVDAAQGATLPVNIQQLPAGIYYLQVNDGANIESLRFTKL
jgi:hypothetical protein